MKPTKRCSGSQEVVTLVTCPLCTVKGKSRSMMADLWSANTSLARNRLREDQSASSIQQQHTSSKRTSGQSLTNLPPLAVQGCFRLRADSIGMCADGAGRYTHRQP